MPLKSDISKKDMTEEDIKNRFVTPALNQSGWESGLILMEKYFTAGRILVPTKGKRHAKKDGNKVFLISPASGIQSGRASFSFARGIWGGKEIAKVGANYIVPAGMTMYAPAAYDIMRQRG